MLSNNQVTYCKDEVYPKETGGSVQPFGAVFFRPNRVFNQHLKPRRVTRNDFPQIAPGVRLVSFPPVSASSRRFPQVSRTRDHGRAAWPNTCHG